MRVICVTAYLQNLTPVPGALVSTACHFTAEITAENGAPPAP
jgi:hypothetical protein